MNELNNLINEFVNKNHDVITYISALEKLSYDKKSFVKFIKEYKDQSNLDYRMHAFLILWFIKYKDFEIGSYTNNPYLEYIVNLELNITDINVKFLELGTHTLIARVNQYYFIINNSAKMQNIVLPDELSNSLVYCINCNDEFSLKDCLDVPSCSFYTFEK